MIGNELIFWVFSAATATAVVAGLLGTRVRGEWHAQLPLTHAAGAALIALFGWEALINLPGTLRAYFVTVAGIPNPPGVEDQQVFMIASAAFVAATAVAVLGIMRTRPWAVVLGVGLAATRVATSLASTANFLTFAESFPPDEVGWQLGSLLALNTVPPLVAIGLLLWPLRRGARRETPPVEAADWHVDPTPEAGR